jgi:hypothetical protein
MRLVEAPPGTPFEPPSVPPEFESRAAFGPGRRYWTMDGTALIGAGRLSLVMAAADGDGSRVVVSAPVEQVEVISKPRWSFGTGLYLRVGGREVTLEPEPIYVNGTSPKRVRRARQRVRDFELALGRARGEQT